MTCFVPKAATYYNLAGPYSTHLKQTITERHIKNCKQFKSGNTLFRNITVWQREKSNNISE